MKQNKENISRYASMYEDVVVSGIDPQIHYEYIGKHLGRDCGNIFTGSQNKKDLISVIIPVYDRVFELEEAIESIINQTYKKWELIIVTDGSPLETLNLLNRYKKHSQIKIYNYKQKSGNAVRGRNRGIKECKGEYVAFLDSDDIAVKNRLEISFEMIKKSRVDVVYGAWTAKIDGTRLIKDLVDGQTVYSPDCNYSFLRKTCVPCQSTVMVSKKALVEVGGLKTKMQYREDHELWARLAFYGYKFKSIEQPLCYLRLHKNNNELNFINEDEIWEKKLREEHRVKNTLTKKVIYLIPGTGISGGIAVILEHCNFLLKNGFDVEMITLDNNKSINWWEGNNVNIVPWNECPPYYLDNIDILVATGWQTFDYLDKINADRKIYFVQSDERRFDPNEDFKKLVNNTYLRNDIEYMTMAQWICEWLKNEFNHNSQYIANGINFKKFNKVHPIIPKTSKIRILLEGPFTIPFKGMKEACNVASKIKDCEIWVVASDGEPDPNFRYDKLFKAVNYGEMPSIYASCDILLKMSSVESFCYPPLEMMAAGGNVVVLNTTGLDEYCVHRENCIIVNNEDEAVDAINELLSNPNLRDNLIRNGLKTAEDQRWDHSLSQLQQYLK
jgi:glycosyltransferase involved in cell wall biosynthesis